MLLASNWFNYEIRNARKNKKKRKERKIQDRQAKWGKIKSYTQSVWMVSQRTETWSITNGTANIIAAISNGNGYLVLNV